MKNVVVRLSLLISLFVITACSTTTQPQSLIEQIKEEPKADRMLVISSAEPNKVLPAFTTFSWDDDYSVVLPVRHTEEERAVKAYIQKELIRFLETKGYKYQPFPKADVVIGFLFAMEDTRASASLLGKFGVLPSSSNKVIQKGYRKGTLLLNVLDAPLEKVYWRTALLGFVELADKLDAQEHEHMQVILNSMLGKFPMAGK